MYDRFEKGANDPAEGEPQSIGSCTYECCKQLIYVGERQWDYDGDWFCSAVCLARYMGAEKRIVEEVD